MNGADLDDDAFGTGTPEGTRSRSFGQGRQLTVADRLGRWLSTRRVRRAVGPVPGRAVADIGCGYHADLARALFGRAGHLLLVDVRVDPRWQHDSRVRIIEGMLPGALAEVADGMLDVVLANNVVEHLWEPELALHEMRRLLRPGGALIVNVPTWWGKRFLELAAFRLHLAPAEEMNDHKTYYDPKDLWPLLVRAGFRPDRIVCRRHKLGLNTIAICRR